MGSRKKRVSELVHSLFLPPSLDSKGAEGKALSSLSPPGHLPQFPTHVRERPAEAGEGTGPREPREGTHVDVAVEHGLEVIRNDLGYLVNQAHQEAAHSVVS